MKPITSRGCDLDVRAEISNTGVVKTAGADPTARDALRAQAGDGGTRLAVARLLLERAPVTAVDVASELELSPPAVRRHLDVMVAEGEATTRDAPRRGPRGRGRPARLYLLTEAGRVRFGHRYDDLAVAALRFLAETGGQHAVRRFAEQRAAELVSRYRDDLADRSPNGAGDASESVADRVGALADVLSAQGYAAATRRAGSGEQLCQHHCPVAHVAAEFPQLCEAETHAFAELLGTHVQRLATIARGDAACTTHVPLDVDLRDSQVRPGIPERDIQPHTGRTSQKSTATTTTIPKGRKRV